MKAQNLKNAIFELAIHGKLVEQNKNDESANILIEKLKLEKDELIKNRSIKKEKPLAKIDDKEKPFNIPDNWQWIRLGEIGLTNVGLTYSPSEISSKGIPVLRSTNIKEGKINYNNLIKVNKEINDKLLVKKNDILICVRNGSKNLISKSALIEEDGMTFGVFMAIYRSQCNKYIHKFINSPLFYKQLNKSNTTTINQITQDTLKNIICPLPPLLEQQCIVNKLEQLMILIDKYNVYQQELSLIQSKFPQDLKNSILNFAIQGKLIKQNKEDEPVSLLLQKIREEKQKLIKEKKLRKEEQLPKVKEDEKLFNVPNNWEWVRIGDVINLFTGNSINKNDKLKKYSNLLEGYNYISTKDIEFNNINYNNGIKIPFNTSMKIGKANSSILCIEGGSAGKKVGFLTQDICFCNKLCVFEPILLNPKYLFYYLQSPIFIHNFQHNKTGIVGGVSISNLKLMPMPLPPLSEQQNIVDKLEILMKLQNKLLDIK